MLTRYIRTCILNTNQLKRDFQEKRKPIGKVTCIKHIVLAKKHVP